MKFLANENIPKRALELLREAGIDIVSVLDAATGLSDLEVLGVGKDQGRILLTFDKDFGNLVFKADAKAKEYCCYASGLVHPNKSLRN
jgi:predicted nuclease of predicted toxin-antitoxin system